MEKDDERAHQCYANLYVRNMEDPLVFKPRQISGSKLMNDNVVHMVPKDGEIVAVSDNGRFKVGDGQTKWKDLEWATRLPTKIVQMRKDNG